MDFTDLSRACRTTLYPCPVGGHFLCHKPFTFLSVFNIWLFAGVKALKSQMRTNSGESGFFFFTSKIKEQNEKAKQSKRWLKCKNFRKLEKSKTKAQMFIKLLVGHFGAAPFQHAKKCRFYLLQEQITFTQALGQGGWGSSQKGCWRYGGNWSGAGN